MSDERSKQDKSSPDQGQDTGARPISKENHDHHKTRRHDDSQGRESNADPISEENDEAGQ